MPTKYVNVDSGKDVFRVSGGKSGAGDHSLHHSLHSGVGDHSLHPRLRRLSRDVSGDQADIIHSGDFLVYNGQ